MKKAIIILLALTCMSCTSVANGIGWLVADPPAHKGGTITRGMSRSEVIEEWGKPRRISSTSSRHGRREIWVYSSMTYGGERPKYYLHFVDGELDAVTSLR